jgi:hypothetical protein
MPNLAFAKPSESKFSKYLSIPPSPGSRWTEKAALNVLSLVGLFSYSFLHMSPRVLAYSNLLLDKAPKFSDVKDSPHLLSSLS